MKCLKTRPHRGRIDFGKFKDLETDGRHHLKSSAHARRILDHNLKVIGIKFKLYAAASFIAIWTIITTLILNT